MLTVQALIVNFLLFLSCFICSFVYIKYKLKDLKFLKIALLLYSLQYLLLLLISVSSYIWELPHIPIPNNLTYTPGFLNIFPDSIGYHHAAISINLLTEIPPPRVLGGHSQTIALIYKIFGTFPMHAIVINLWGMMILSMIIYLINGSMNSSRSARYAACFALLSPSIFILNSQLGKDMYDLTFTTLVVYYILKFVKGKDLFKLPQATSLGLVCLFSLWLLSYRTHLGHFISGSLLLVILFAAIQKYFIKSLSDFSFGKTAFLMFLIPLIGISSKVFKPEQLSAYLFLKDYQHSKYLDFSNEHMFTAYYNILGLHVFRSGFEHAPVLKPPVEPEKSEVKSRSSMSNIIVIIKKYEKKIVTVLFAITLVLLFFLWIQFFQDKLNYFPRAFICCFFTLYCGIAYYVFGDMLAVYYRMNENGIVVMLTTLNIPLAWQTFIKIKNGAIRFIITDV